MEVEDWERREKEEMESGEKGMMGKGLARRCWMRRWLLLFCFSK